MEWTFDRHADVRQALHDPQLVPVGQTGPDAAPHQAVRAATAQALGAQRLASWREAWAGQAHALIDPWSAGTPIDLVAALAEPWSHEVALAVTGAPRERLAACEALARQLFDASACSRDGTLPGAALEAAAHLAQQLGTARPGVDVQAFVALTQSLPALLAGAWLALLRDRAALATLLAEPAAVARSISELIRHGSPSRALFRQAIGPTRIGTSAVEPGDRITLLLAAANHDPLCFPDPERLDLGRDTSAALPFGSGPHHCAGTALVRLALQVATTALLERTADMVLAHDTAPPWRGGHALRAPAALWVHWQPRAQRPAR